VQESRAIAAGEAPPDGSWSEVGRWTITDPNSLTAIRRGVTDAVRPRVIRAAGARSMVRRSADAAERLSLVTGELAANGLRHALPPITVALSFSEGFWLVVVSDHPSYGRPVLREPDSEGGIGLHLVLAVSEHVGWHMSGTTRCVWAVVGATAV